MCQYLDNLVKLCCYQESTWFNRDLKAVDLVRNLEMVINATRR